MAQFRSFEPGVEVNGQTIMSVVAGMGVFKDTGIRYLADAGLTDVRADDRHWYPQQAWLDAFHRISEELGDNTLFFIGLKIPENAIFPKEIDGIEKALASIDVAYHMNHRNRRGEVLFDPLRPAPRRMLDGIGHYGFEPVAHGNEAILVCENPYPCAFDRGIIQAMAHKFKGNASVLHDNTKPCRKNGLNSCTYVVRW
jgi:hypothetical protein